ncbi:MAG: alkaline phosphatase family protein [Planctomycetes bacterium]|nr:alkaline phosphatase family protein [Planctomycetota bacterium]
MRRRSFVVIGVPIFLSLATLATGQKEEDHPRPPRDIHVLVVSIDGLRPDAIPAARGTPAINALAAAGARAARARTVFPSSTLPSHTSMLTGLVPSRHRVMLWNSYDPERGHIEATTCLELAGRAGYRTAMIAGKEKFWHLSRGVDHYERPGGSAGEVARAAAAHMKEAKPGLAFVHFADPDSAGHEHGWMTEPQFEAIREVDRGLARILDALAEAEIRETTVIVVTADHGGHGKTHGTWLDEDMSIPWIAAGPGIRKGTLIEREIRTYDTAATALALLGVPVPGDWDGRPVVEAFEASTDR